MFVRIALIVFLSVLQQVVCLRDGEAFAYSLFPADVNTKESQEATSHRKEAVALPIHVFDDCDEELEKLEEVLEEFCVKHMGHGEYEVRNSCTLAASNVVHHGAAFKWGTSLVTCRLGAKVPVFWAGFSECDKSGMASKEDLANFVQAVNGLLLHGGGLVDQTEWGTAVQEANDLKSCSSWEEKKPFWTAASIAMAQAVRYAAKSRIVIAVRKELNGEYSLFKSILYLEEFVKIGAEMRSHKEWNPSFEVHEIPVAKSSECTVAPWLKKRLEDYAQREVAMTCALCPKGLPACNRKPQTQVTKAKMTYDCVAGDCLNGKGDRISADGDRYKGNFKNGLPDGEGKLFHFNGNRYEGNFKKGMRHGKGKYSSPEAHYEGDFQNGEMHGEGTYVFANGDRYKGHFQEGRMDGKGKIVFVTGASYEGDFKDWQMDGSGKYCSWADDDCQACLFEKSREVRCEEIPTNGLNL